MSLFKSMDISASGLTAQSFRMDIIAQNIANAETTRTADGTPYQRRIAILAQQKPSFDEAVRSARFAQGQTGPTGVIVTETQADDSPFEMVFNPDHPDADASGYVRLPNVEIAREYVDMISASRSYEANLTVLNAAKRLAVKALEMGR
jgi:flagellar basal-body rod protein FlgC